MQKIIVTGAALLAMGGCATVPQDVGMGSILYVTTTAGNIVAQLKMADNLSCEVSALSARKTSAGGEKIGCTTWDRGDQLPHKIKFSNMQGMQGADAKMLALEAVNTEVCMNIVSKMLPELKKGGGKIEGTCL